MQVTLVQCSPRANGGTSCEEVESLRGVNGSKRGRVSTSQMKKMLITFFDIKCTVKFEYVTQGPTVRQAYYKEQLKRLRKAVHRNRLELWTNDWILHHDNAPPHKAFFGPKINYWNVTPSLCRWFGSEWLLAVSQSKVFLEVTKISSYPSVFLTVHHAMEAYWGSTGIAPYILDLGPRWNWVVSFTPQLLYPQGKSPWYPLDRRLGDPPEPI
jgi:hypothetical protein